MPTAQLDLIATASAKTIELALRAHPSVVDCVVACRQSDAGSREIAYVVVSAPCRSQVLLEHLQALLPGTALPAVVQVSSLPLAADGSVDTTVLQTLPVIDAGVVEQTERRLRSFEAVFDAAVIVGEQRHARLPLHVSDVVPIGVSGSRRERQTVVSREAGAEPPESTGRVALVAGGPLLFPEGSPATLGGSLERTAATSTGAALSFIQADGSEVTQSYADLLHRAERVVGGLRARGLRPHDAVLLQLERIQDFLAAFWGCVLGGFIPVPVGLAASYAADNSAAAKLGHACAMFDRPLVVASDGLADAIRAFVKDAARVDGIEQLLRGAPDVTRHDSDPDDVALIMLTSGSTGAPKGVMLSHRNLLSRSQGSRQLNGFSDRDISLNWMPMDHVAGIIYFHLRDVYLGCRQVHAPTELVLQRPVTWLDWIDRYRATITFAPNFAFGLVNEHAAEIAAGRWDLSSMRFILNGAEAIVARTSRRFLTLLEPHGLAPDVMHPAWGMSETSSGVVYSSDFTLASTTDDDPFVEVGVPIPGFSIRIADADGQAVSEGTVGRLQVSGATVTRGYFKRPDLTSAAFTADGWFDTGDLAIVRRGRLAITGREKDDIVVNGIKYYSHEVEGAVDEMPEVAASFTAACGVRRDGSDTEELAVFFVPRSTEPGDVAGTMRSIRQRIFKRVGIMPACLVAVGRDDIPKTSLGKIQRSQLRQQLESGAFDRQLKQADLLIENANTIPDWFFTRTWRRKAASRESTLPDGAVLLVGGADGFELTLAREIERRGRSVILADAGEAFCENDGRFCVRANSSEDHQRLLDAIAIRGLTIGSIVHVGACAPANFDAAPAKLQRDGEVLGVLALAQALASRDRLLPIRTLVASTGAQLVREHDPVSLDRAALSGLIKTVIQEIPLADFSHVDLDVSDQTARAGCLIDELSTRSGDREVAFRAGERFVPRLERADMAAAARRDLPVKVGGCYLLTGGLGGVGVEVATFLLHNYSARLLIVGRHALGEDGSGAAERRAALRVLEAAADTSGGAVVYTAASAASHDEMRAAVEGARSRWGCDLDGVFHLAAVFRDRLIAEETPDSFNEILEPKLEGSWIAAEAVDGRAGSLFVSFSSATSFFGRVSGAAYAAANAPLHAFTAILRRRGIRAYCIEWSIWDDIGMNRGYSTSTARGRGYQAIGRKQGLQSLLGVVSRDQPTVFVGLDGSSPHVRMHVADECCASEGLTGYVVASEGTLPRVMTIDDRFGMPLACAIERVPAIPRLADGRVDVTFVNAGAVKSGAPAAPRNEMERLIAATWQDVLNVPHVDTESTFFDVGGSSLLMAKVYARLKGRLPRPVSMTELFRYPTISAFAAFLGGAGQNAKAEEDSVAQDRERGRERRARLLKARAGRS